MSDKLSAYVKITPAIVADEAVGVSEAEKGNSRNKQ